VIAALGIVAVVGTWFLGRPVIALLFGADRDTTESVPLVVLTASAAVFMAVLLLQSALVALRRHRALVLAWVAGAVAFALCFAIPLAPVDQGVLAQITGPVVTLAAQLAVLSRYLRVGAAATTPATG
jgi:O-antigen/teichoic acid export membrane protein